LLKKNFEIILVVRILGGQWGKTDLVHKTSAIAYSLGVLHQGKEKGLGVPGRAHGTRQADNPLYNVIE
jgi:hypothetical protein